MTRRRGGSGAGRSVATAIGLVSVAASVAILRLSVAAPDDAPEVAPVRAARVESAIGQTWTCAVGSGIAGVRHELILTNLAESPATLTVRSLRSERLVAAPDANSPSPDTQVGSSTSAPVSEEASSTAVPSASSSSTASTEREAVAGDRTTTVELDAATTEVIEVGDLGSSGAVAIESAGGQVVVEHAVSVDGRRSQSPCVTAVSDRWYGAGVGTPRGTELSLSLTNPGVSTATVEVEFATAEGVRAPTAFSSLQIDPGSSVELDVDEVVQRQDDLAFEVRAKRGTVVAEALERGAGGVRLLEVSPAAASRWFVPVGVAGENVAEALVVFNPGSRRATAEVGVVAVDADPSLSSEPFELSIAPFSTARLELADESRVEPERAHMIEVISQGSDIVVAQRQTIAGAPSDVAIDRPPVDSASFGTSGASIRSSEWTAGCPVVPAGSLRCVVALSNPGTASTSVDILGVGGGRPQPLSAEPVEVGPGEVRLVELELPDDGGWSVVVQGSRPLVVGRLVSWDDPVGVANSLAVPTSNVAKFGS